MSQGESAFYKYSSSARRYLIAPDFTRPRVGTGLRWDSNGGFVLIEIGSWLVLRSDDGAFAYRSGCYACTPGPIRLFTLGPDGLIDVTSGYPAGPSAGGCAGMVLRRSRSGGVAPRPTASVPPERGYCAGQLPA